jgi:hypothetical protein
MRQALVAQGMISKLKQAVLDNPDIDPCTKEILDALRELHRYIQLVEHKLDEVEVQANRRRFY